MITPNELMQIKYRIMTACEIASHLSEGEDQLELTPEAYEMAQTSLRMLKGDCQRVFAELDVLRGMFADKIGAFFMEGFHGEAEGFADSSRPVGDVQSPPDEVSSGDARDDSASTGGGVQGERPARKSKRPRSKPVRNSRKGKTDS